MSIDAKPQTERRTPLTRERVLQTALDLADRDGLEALSMRRLGPELGVEAMALYRHVRDKDDLLDGLLEALVGQIEIVRPDRDWKAALREQSMTARRTLLRHPWARRLLEERGTAGSAMLDYIEGVLAILRAGGFTLDLAHHALHVLGARIFGFNQDIFEDSTPTDPSAPPDPIRSGLLADRYPRITELATSVSHDGVLGACDDDVEFAFGLDLVLEGLERRLMSDRPRSRPSRTASARRRG
jgi:AcrR family transcriptional regulator